VKIAYITAHAPFGTDETFVLDEMLAVVEIGTQIIIIPRNPPKKVFHAKGELLLRHSVWLPLINGQIVFSFLKALITKPRLFSVLWMIIRYSRSLIIILKNLAVVPKAVHIASLLYRAKVEHIHVHWGSTTATMGWVASELTGIPWSATLHRWDIAEDNLLKIKVQRAAFIRCIAEDGRREVLNITGNEYRNNVFVLYMGVRLPNIQPVVSMSERSCFTAACPANFVEKKGHKFLIEAFGILVKKGFRNLRCLIIGDGGLESEIRRQIAENNLEDIMLLKGRLPNEVLMGMYGNSEIDAVILPSIITSDKEREGIPVALMEAMAYSIPVISTDTGGIFELLADGAGIIVKERDSIALADAIECLIMNSEFAKETAVKGRQRITDVFNLSQNVGKLLQLINKSRHPVS